jgi:hypothetical protein
MKIRQSNSFFTVADSHVGEPFDDMPLDRFCKRPAFGDAADNPQALPRSRNTD